jgi:hypothetical protein
MKRIAVATILLPFFAACSAVSTNAGPEIRVENASQSDFSSVRVVFPSEDVSYGALPAGATSEYESVAEAYRYAYVEVMIGERRVVLQPIDYVGETLLGPGRYTYALDVMPGGDFLSLQLKTD